MTPAYKYYNCNINRMSVWAGVAQLGRFTVLMRLSGLSAYTCYNCNIHKFEAGKSGGGGGIGLRGEFLFKGD
jgi:hypothetical protein